MSLTGPTPPSPPSPPPFTPINVSNVANAALNQDLTKYFSYQFPVFPGMTDLRNQEITDAYNQLTQPLSSDFSNTFMRNATVAGQAATGSGDLYSGMAYGNNSFAKGAQSASFTRQDLAKEDYDRSRFESLMQQNPIPGLGLSQNDLLSMYVYNTGAQNAYNMGNYANSIAAANAQAAASQNTWNSIGNLISGLGTSYYNYSMYNGGFTPNDLLGGQYATATFGGYTPTG